MDLSRRGYLRAVLGGTAVTALADGSEARSNKVDRVSDPSTFDLSHSTDVMGSFLNVSAATPYLMGNSGWADVPLSEKIRTIRRLHAEKLDLHRDFGGSEGPPTRVASGEATVQGHFAEDAALLAAGQQHLNVNLKPLNLWLDKLPESERWMTSNGNSVISAIDLAARRFNGDPKRNERFGSAVPTLFFDQYRDHMADAAVTFLRHGYSQVYLDNAIAPTWRGLDFSSWATTAFRDHLSSLSASRLDKLGVDDPGTFDIVDHLERGGLGVDDARTPFEDPVAREYKRFQLRSHREYVQAYRDRIHDAFPDQSERGDVVVVGNLGMDKLDPTAVLLADAFDAVYGESEQTVPGRKVIDRSYKLGNAAGRFDRPVVSVGSMLAGGQFETSSAEGLNPSAEYTTLQNLQLAEGFANGGMRSVSLAGWGMSSDQAVDNWVRPDGTVPAALQSFLDFCWAQKPFLTGGESAHDVALVYSLPTATWERAPLWDSWHSQHTEAVEGMADLLRRHQLPYDVVVFGLPGVWDDADQLERLSTYQTVVLPSVDAVSDAQADRIRAVLEDDVRVVATGGGPSTDADKQARDDVRQYLNDHAQATVVDATPGATVANDEQPRTDLAEPLTAAGRQVQLDVDGVVPTVRRQDDADRTVVHLVNYDYDRTEDAVSTHEDVSLAVRAPDTDVGVGRWLSPAGRSDLDVTTDGDQYRVTIPNLGVWGMLVLAADSTALNQGDETAATEAVDTAATAVDEARSSGRTHVDLARADAELENAKVAADHGAYDLAEAAAERSVDAASTATEPPVVGIDESHGQSDAGYYWAAFDSLRERFDRYQYEPVEEWSAEILSTLDLLLVPPSTDGYGFTRAELDRVQSFVETGGRVVVLGNASVASDIDDLLGQYDLGFDGDPIVQPGPVFGRVAEEGTSLRRFDAIAEPSTLTQFAISFRSVDATPVFGGEDTQELAHVHEQRGAFVNRSGSVNERSEGDVPADGMPLLAATVTGDGYVATLGTAEHFVAPTQSRNGARIGDLNDPLVRSILRTAESGSPSVATASTTEGSTRTDDSTATTPSDTPTTETETTSASSPGFGLGTGVAGVAGSAALVRWLLREGSE